MPTADKVRTILFVHNSNDYYGAEVILLTLIRGLDPALYRAVVALPEDMRHLGRLSKRLDDFGIAYRFLPLAIMRRKYLRPARIAGYLVDLIRGTLGLCRLIRRNNIDLVQSNTLAVVSGALAAKIMHRPHVWHVHEFLTVPAGLRRALHWMAAHLSARVVTVSNAVRQHILKDQPHAAGSVITIHNGIDLAPYLAAKSGSSIRAELQIPEDATVVGMVGRVSRWKGQQVFTEAARLVAAKCPALYFVAVGGVFDDEHHYMDAFRRAVTRCGLERFRISDFRQDIPEVLSAFDLFVLPSTEPDSFPTVILEAMASGLPVIGSAIGGVPEMIADGETGLLVPPNDPEALAEAIRKILQARSLSESMGRRGRQRAIANFQPPRFIRSFEQIYEQLLADK
jgi:glycosyltransferase involved in cell wall biosynthesis